MQKILFVLLFLVYMMTSCNTSVNSNTDENSKTFTNIDSALKYCSVTKSHKSLLFALVNSNIKQNQKLGWDILGDKDIIKTAKRDYVLIIIEPTKISLPANIDTEDFSTILKTQKESPYFVVTNQVFYPFRQFTLITDKESIIDDLEIGEGP